MASSPRAGRLLMIALMLLGALAGVATVFLGVDSMSRSLVTSDVTSSDAMLAMIEIVLLPLGLALGASCGALIARWLNGPSSSETPEGPAAREDEEGVTDEDARIAQ